jgi:DNA polymerase III alpha subunit
MTDNMIVSPPTKFVGLHSHSTNGSIFDAIGTPAEHIDFARSNGMDALALTDHGNMAGYSFQQAHLKNLSKKGINFRGLAGVESYYVPSLSQWKIDYELSREAGTLKPLKKKSKTAKEVVGDELFSTKQDLESIKDDDTDGGTIVENEEESKQTKVFNPIKARSHLVVLAKNSEGLKGLFSMVSDSSKNGFYVVPRIDLDMLRRYSKGNFIVTSACIGGFLARIIFNHQPQEQSWEDWKPSNHNFEVIQSELKKAIETFQEALGGEENYYLETQLNKLSQQHLVNMHLIEAAKRTNAKLVVTCDAHYSNPAHWKEREIYKALGWQQMGKTDIKIPESIEELKCELYPKNATQLWETYHQVKKNYDFYDDQTIKDAIERTYDIAHNQIGEVLPDRSTKLPALNKIIPLKDISRIKEDLTKEGKDASDDEAVAFRELKELAIQGLKDRKKAHDKVYIDRLKYELEVVKHLKFSRYFLTYYWIMKEVGKKQILGMGRGCFLPGNRVKMAEGLFSPIEAIQIGENVLDAFGEIQTVENTHVYECDEDVVELEFSDGKIIRCTKDHKILTTNRGWVIANEITNFDYIKEI